MGSLLFSNLKVNNRTTNCVFCASISVLGDCMHYMICYYGAKPLPSTMKDCEILHSNDSFNKRAVSQQPHVVFPQRFVRSDYRPLCWVTATEGWLQGDIFLTVIEDGAKKRGLLYFSVVFSVRESLPCSKSCFKGNLLIAHADNAQTREDGVPQSLVNLKK